MKKRISILTPCFNEGENVVDCHQAVRRVFTTALREYDYEHVFCDNASTDDTVARLRRLADQDPRVKLILNARNFGPFRSAFNGLMAATGDAVLVFLAADLQDPPELIPEFVRRWEAGHEVVYGVRRRREENALLAGLRRLYYRLLRAVADDPMPVDVGEFQLIDRAVVEALRGVDDHHPYIRGLIASCGFRATGFDYTWVARRKGTSKNRWYHLVDQGLNGLVSSSSVPMRLSIGCGLLLATASLGWAAIRLAVTPVVALFFFAGLQFLFLGILGEYVMAIHAQVRRRPLVVERERVNFDARPRPRRLRLGRRRRTAS